MFVLSDWQTVVVKGRGDETALGYNLFCDCSFIGVAEGCCREIETSALSEFPIVGAEAPSNLLIVGAGDSSEFSIVGAGAPYDFSIVGAGAPSDFQLLEQMIHLNFQLLM